MLQTSKRTTQSRDQYVHMCALMPCLQDAELTRGQLRAKMHEPCSPHGAPKYSPESSTRTTIAEAKPRPSITIPRILIGHGGAEKRLTSYVNRTGSDRRVDIWSAATHSGDS
jgi:hypothetical protein